MNYLKDKGLTKVSLFKNNFCESWTYLPKTGQVVIHKDTPATDWTKFIIHNQVAGASGVGYKVNRYKRGRGIKGASPYWDRVAVKVKNKPNHIKAVEYLGKYAQHKPLFDEVVKTLDFLDK